MTAEKAVPSDAAQVVDVRRQGTDPARPPRGRSFYLDHLKRPLDLLLSAVLLLLLSPVLVIVSLAILILDGPPVFFHQMRPGLGTRPFGMVKFRTMREATEVEQELLSDASRLTSLGPFLRKTSLDEMPQLFNVLSGSMSLVGPRPLLTRYLPYFRTEERKRFGVRPGITGLAQVRGRNLLSWDDRLALDVRYHEEVSLGLDVLILLETVRSVLFARGVAVVPDLLMANLDVERRGEVKGKGTPGGAGR